MKKCIVVFLVIIFNYKGLSQCKDITALYIKIKDISPARDRDRGTIYITIDSNFIYKDDLLTRIIPTDKKTLIVLSAFLYQHDNGINSLVEEGTGFNIYEVFLEENSKTLLHYILRGTKETRNFFSELVKCAEKNKLDQDLIQIMNNRMENIIER